MRTRIARGYRRAVATIAALGLVATMAACGSSDDDTNSASAAVTAEGTDDGSELTLWTRAPLELQAKALVDAYNKSHKNQVKLTIVPNDDYVAKVGAAAGSGDLPDLFAADIVYVPNWTKAGLFSDMTERIKLLPYADKINQGHIKAGTFDGKEYVLPFVLDLSVMFWNKALYKEAGLDPEKGPATLDEYKAHALAIQKLNKKDTYGTYFGGNCGGCGVFTWFPMVWASGEEVMDAEGTKSLLDGPAAQKVYSTFRELQDAGAIAPAAKDDTGATWVAAFQEGKIGVMPYPATLLPTAAKTVDVGVAPIPGVSAGSGSTFLGGDGIGISKDSKLSDQSWNFLAWLTSEAAQVDVLAANNSTVARTDLADNQYSAKDPRVVTVNQVAASPQSKTPFAINFQQAFNAPGSPWVTLFRNQVYGDAGALAADNTAVSGVLGQ
ncbi:multiple sugar transport system substrate-binding protein [Actinoplanes lutulentus]|uniref:Multiple sugar transport system substrate-binding protein n=1 Tax=Actinoplanes lutulentus TaxID=1287878 RepID=A0A327Z8K6_9ACTN|nr:sugar ABC transporter substrate-binding protein [Actinoplanes lutulentus]MBB2943602.1 multiple sugar transport system substrate-binding protein [Actinoplanes lutulentus]RAK27467.1 multiple sugar transport system substrate-binding protein [Actinoplanes lutulentus]